MTAVATKVPAGTYHADAVHSTTGFAVKHMLVSTFRGAFDEVDATLTISEDGESRLAGTVPVRSLTIRQEDLLGHLHSEVFFDTERHPELRFESTRFGLEGDEVVLEGELTIKGITQRVTARGGITEATPDAYGGTRVGLLLETIVDRTRFDLLWNAPLPKGGMALANDVTLTIELELVQQ